MKNLASSALNISVKKTLSLALIGLGALTLVACGSNPSRGGSGLGTVSDVDTNALSTGTTTVDASSLQIDTNTGSEFAPTERTIYFDFDNSEVRSEYLDIVVQHGRFLAENPQGRVRLEGHTDERGTREYNIALGENRAQSIARMLQLQGVSSAQVRSVSYGEELPIDENHSADAWAKNRRVQIIYENAPVQN